MCVCRFPDNYRFSAAQMELHLQKDCILEERLCRLGCSIQFEAFQDLSELALQKLQTELY